MKDELLNDFLHAARALSDAAMTGLTPEMLQRADEAMQTGDGFELVYRIDIPVIVGRFVSQDEKRAVEVFRIIPKPEKPN